PSPRLSACPPTAGQAAAAVLPTQAAQACRQDTVEPVWRRHAGGKPQSMRLDKFTEKAQEALQEAAELARATGNQAVEPEHLLLALVREDEGVARTLLERTGASVQALEPALVSAIERFPKVSGGGQPYLSEALTKHLQQAEREAERLKDEYISTEHLLLA